MSPAETVLAGEVASTAGGVEGVGAGAVAEGMLEAAGGGPLAISICRCRRVAKGRAMVAGAVMGRGTLLVDERGGRGSKPLVGSGVGWCRIGTAGWRRDSGVRQAGGSGWG